MKVREGFFVREIADSIVAVPTGKLVLEFEGMIELNQRGKFMWELLKEDITIEEIADKLIEKYGLDKEEAIKIAEDFTQKLKDAGVIE